MSADVTLFLHGGIAVVCFFVGFKFLRFWVSSRDRFYLWFVAAFWVFSVGWVIRAFGETSSEDVYYVYVPRLISFLLIIAAILDKNRNAPD